MELNDALQNLMDSVCALSPELSRTLNDPMLSEEEKLMTLLGIVQKTPALQDQIMALASQKLGGEAQYLSNPGEKQPLPRINPLVEAALIDRLQFDGDAPELRTGPLPENTDPAVPVTTQVKNPVALGNMLNTASKQVKEAIEDHFQKQIQAITEDKESLKIIKSHGELVSELTNIDHDLTTYRRGEVPKPVTVDAPSGSDLLTITETERRVLSWKFLSTTQGRQTGVFIIQDDILDILQDHDIALSKQDYDPHTKPVVLATAKWSVDLSNSIQPAFSLLDTAAKVMAKKLIQALDKLEPSNKPMILEVTTLDHHEARIVGWVARIIQKT